MVQPKVNSLNQKVIMSDIKRNISLEDIGEEYNRWSNILSDRYNKWLVEMLPEEKEAENNYFSQPIEIHIVNPGQKDKDIL